MHAESLGHAGAEAIGLNQCTNKGSDVVNTGAFHQIAESFSARFAGTHLQVDKVELIAKIRMSMVEILADAHEGLIEGQAGLDADDSEIERIGQSEANAVLAVPDHSLQDEARKKESQARDTSQQKWIVEARKENDPDEPNCCHEHAGAEVIIDVDRVAESGLNQPPPCPRIRRLEKVGSPY